MNDPSTCNTSASDDGSPVAPAKRAQGLIGDVRAAGCIFLYSRVLVLMMLVLSAQASFDSVPAREGANLHLQLELGWTSITRSLERIWRSADASWYLEIAEEGYPELPVTTDHAYPWVFFPLYPLLIRLLANLIGSTLAAGLLLSNAAFFGALVLLRRYLRKQGFERPQIACSLWMAALYPTSYFFSSPLTESLFLFLSIGAFTALEDRKLVRSGLWMLLAGAARPTGLLIVPAYAARMLQVALPGAAGVRWSAGAALLLAPLGAVWYCAYLYLITGSPIAFSINQSAWGRPDPGNAAALGRLLLELGEPSRPWNFVWLNAAAAAFVLIASGYFFVRRRLDWSLLLAVPILVALSTGTLQSMCRFTMALFPTFIALGACASFRWCKTALLALFAASLAVMTVLYALHVTGAMA